MGGVNTLVVLDSGFAAGLRSGRVLEATRQWIDSNKPFYTSRNLSGGPAEDWGSGWLALGGGVVYVEKTPDVKTRLISRLRIPEDPLRPGLYHWDQTHPYPVYWLILILPRGTTLKSASPEPNDAGDLGDRFAVFWESISPDGLASNVDISWELATYAADDRDREVNRLRAQLPLAIHRRASVLRRIAYMRRGLGFLFLIMASIAAWISLPPGLAISPPHISAFARIPATVVCVITVAISIMGLLKGWSLANLLALVGASKRGQ